MAEARSGIVTLLFTDLENSTPLLEKLGDDEYEVLRRAHFRLLREAVAAHGGEEVKTIGDAIMVVFPSAVDALGCAVAMQDVVHNHNQREEEGRRLQMRVGLHAGEPIRDERDYSGKSVVVTDRLCASAHGGQILASELVRGLVGSRGGYTFRALGPLTLKGIADPVNAFEVIWRAVVEQQAPDVTVPQQAAAAPSAGTETKASVTSAFRTILFTDVVESTSLTQRLGDVAAWEALRPYQRIVHEAVQRHGSAETKRLGDGFMASFTSATRALECAIAILQASAEHSESAREPLKIRIGLNAGEPIEDDGDLFGTAVMLAALISRGAEAGQILVSEAVRQIVAGRKFLFSDRGETALRGFEDPVRLYEVRWQET
ncbi:MAG: adenylate/guanylate cyclase domain-containing protein [Chloroflexi bacterium]|nr:adenylate/guanylate cyclase domain-containing protein [Chloroflexota bacterium]